MTREELKRRGHCEASLGSSRTICRQESEEIERQTQEFLANGGQITTVTQGQVKTVDLHFRHYAKTATEAAEVSGK